MKKALVLILLSLVNTMILAHAVIPHHHEDIQAVGHCKSLHCHGNANDCSLTEGCLKFDNAKQSVQSSDFHLNLPSSFLSLFPIYSIPSLTDDKGISFKQKRHLLSFRTEYISRSCGLRAPPFEL
ncbi:MAG: hypothetical protein FWF52_03185 [Candidatus Azobacteroides sp.]|nr:hypothetical protein [Candidatus Azobacteroides sp.]